MSLKDKIAIIGVGCTKFGDNFDMEWSDMVIDAAKEAMNMAGITRDDIDAGWLSTFNPDMSGYDGHSGVSLAGALKLWDRPISRVVNYCASGVDAFRNACMAVACGESKMAIVAGVEKMRDVAPRESLVNMSLNQGHPVLGKGFTAPGLFAMCATKYLEHYNLDRRVLASVAVKNHAHGTLNPKAHFQKEISVEQVLEAPMICEPLGLYDCCPTTDGAAVAIITTPENAKALAKNYVLVKAIGLSIGSSESVFFNKNFDFLGFRATREAAKIAYRDAGITNPAKEIDVVELHDCFTITELLTYEDLQFCEKGKGYNFLMEGHPFLEGDLPINPSGGLKSCGHPIGATGLRMIYEITQQLMQKAGKKQVFNPKLGLIHNLGGAGNIASVAILGIN